LDKKITSDSDVLIVLEDGKNRIVRFRNQNIETHSGVISSELLRDLEYGRVVLMSTGKKAYVLEPVLVDYLPKLHRRTQIIYPKEAGYLILKLGVRPGFKVLEGGTGSGIMTSIIANFVGPSGKVVSYDVNSDSLKISEENLRRLDLADRVELRLGDLKEVPEVCEYDCAILDLPNPWSLLPDVWRALKPSGRVAIAVPTFNQLDKLAASLEKCGFLHLETVDIWASEVQFKHDAIRPKPMVRGHNTFLTFAAKIYDSHHSTEKDRLVNMYEGSPSS
jgi:tRNA (adenine57-N1/adenine58-N1)-methyltransferase